MSGILGRLCNKVSILCFGIQGMLDKDQAIVFLFLFTLAQLLFSSLRHIKCQQPLWKCFMFAFEDLVSSSILINQTHQTYAMDMCLGMPSQSYVQLYHQCYDRHCAVFLACLQVCWQPGSDSWWYALLGVSGLSETIFIVNNGRDVNIIHKHGRSLNIL